MMRKLLLAVFAISIALAHQVDDGDINDDKPLEVYKYDERDDVDTWQNYHIMAFMNVESLNDFFQSFVPLGAYFGFVNKGFEIGYKKSSWLYEVELNSMYVNQLAGFKEKKLEVVGRQTRASPDRLGMTLTGVNFDATLNCSITILGLFQFSVNEVLIEGLSMKHTVMFTDKFHQGVFQITDDSHFGVEAITIQLEDEFLDSILQVFQKQYQRVLKNIVEAFPSLVRKELYLLTAQINNYEDNYKFSMAQNTSLLSGSDTVAYFNMTPAHPPKADFETKMLTMSFDGLWNEPPTAENLPTVSKLAKPTELPRYLDDVAQTDQVWIHQNTLSSYLQHYKDQVFPMRFDIGDQMFDRYPHLRKHSNLTLEIEEMQTIELIAQRGIVFGGKDVTLKIKCRSHTCLELRTDIEVDVKFEMKDMRFYLNLSDVQLTNVTKHKDLFELKRDDFAEELGLVIQEKLDDLNAQYMWLGPDGFKLSDLPDDDQHTLARISQINAMVKNSIITPYMEDEWLFAGFSSYQDTVRRNKKQ